MLFLSGYFMRAGGGKITCERRAKIRSECFPSFGKWRIKVPNSVFCGKDDLDIL
jgi:hypothetical protein